MVDALSQQEINDAKFTFTNFDKRKNGTLSVADLGLALRCNSMSPTEAEVKELSKRFDRNEDDFLEFPEFLEMITIQKEQDEKKSLEKDDVIRCFKLFDKAENGFLSGADLRHIMTTMGEPLDDVTVDSLLKEADKENNGQIDYKEFVAGMYRK
ncbi:uncharacterized protein LOC141910158 [Tubulanus polymorphus]|uniref:uncharacterized protein LOC141910158 n=1 Tax=Tubulanus polymorphus TaxID=672921 RepID=UPI003DA328A9